MGNEVGAYSDDCITMPRTKLHIFLRLLKKQSKPAFDYIECIADIVVGVPRHRLRRR